MDIAQAMTPSSSMLDAAFRVASLRADLRDEARADVVPVVQRRERPSARSVLRAVAARGYRIVVPAARPILMRWRQYNSSVLLHEITLLRQDLQAVQAAQLEGARPVVSSARPARPPRAPSETAGLLWSIDDERMPHLNAAIEHLDRHVGGRLVVSGTPAQLAIAARDVGAWLDRTSTSAEFGGLTIIMTVAEPHEPGS